MVFNKLSQNNTTAATATIIMATLQMAPFPGVPLVGVGVELPELVWLPVEEASWLAVKEAAEVVEADAAEDLESPVVVGSPAIVVEVVVEVVVAAATRKPSDLVSLTPQRASASKVKSMFLALHSLCCRVMESIFMKFISCDF